MTASKDGSITMFLAAEPVLRALRAAGLTVKVQSAIVADPWVAEAAAKAATQAYEKAQEKGRIRPSPETLATPIVDTSLPARERHILELLQVTTLGELALTHRGVVRYRRGVGPAAFAAIEELLASYGLSLLDDWESIAKYACFLYGGAGSIPAKMMRLWQPELDATSQQWLAQFDNLSEVSSRTLHGYDKWRKQLLNEDRSVRLRQLMYLDSGLREAGLGF